MAVNHLLQRTMHKSIRLLTLTPRMHPFRCYSQKYFQTLSQRNRVLLVSGAAFTGTLMASHFIGWPGPVTIDASSVMSHLHWDSYLRKFVDPQKISVTNESSSEGAAKLNAVPCSRFSTGPSNIPGLSLTLFQYQTCPFCCKVRAFLDYYGIPYKVVEVNPVMRQQLKDSKYKKVPILLVNRDGSEENDERKDNSMLQLNDSSVIISTLGSYLLCNPDLGSPLEEFLKLYQKLTYKDLVDNKTIGDVVNKYFLMYGDSMNEKELKENENQLAEERFWRKWVDDDFVHLLSPNIYRTLRESIDSFNYFSKVGDWEQNFSKWERLIVVYVGASAMCLISRRLKKKYSLKPDVRESLYDGCRRWTKAIGKDRIFMGGNKPNLADISVYGVLSSIEGCDAFQDILKNTNIGKWFFMMKEACNEHAGSNELKYLNIVKN